MKTKANKKPVKISKRGRSFLAKAKTETGHSFYLCFPCFPHSLFSSFCSNVARGQGRGQCEAGQCLNGGKQVAVLSRHCLCVGAYACVCVCVRRARSKARINANKDNSRVIRFSARCPCSLPTHTKTHLIMCHSFCFCCCL